MFEQQKVIERKRINMHVPSSSKIRVLTPDEIGELSTVLNKISALENYEKKLETSVGPIPMYPHRQGMSENCTENTNHHPEFPSSITQTDVVPQDLQNALKRENMYSAIQELTNLHKTAKYQAFIKRVIDGQPKTDEKDGSSSDVIQIKSDSDDESDGGKSAKSSQRSSKEERRKKNKEAARRCRMKKKMLQNEIAIRAAFLAQENSELRKELDMLKQQMGQLRGELKNRFKN